MDIFSETVWEEEHVPAKREEESHQCEPDCQHHREHRAVCEVHGNANEDDDGEADPAYRRGPSYEKRLEEAVNDS